MPGMQVVMHSMVHFCHGQLFFLRQKVKEEIARDQAERQARQKEKAPPVAAPQPTSTAVKKDYDTCRLQVIVPISLPHKVRVDLWNMM